MGDSMSSIVVSGDTSGAITLAAPAVSGTNTLTLPALTGTILTNATPGTILQVVNTTFSTRVTSSSSTYADTGMSLSITPRSTTSKILILVNMNDVDKVSSDTYAGFRVVRGSTTVVTFATAASYTQSSATNSTGCGVSYLDSPATASSVTYKVQFASNNNTSYIAINDGITGTASSNMTLMEVAA